MKIIIVALRDIDLPSQAFNLSDEQVYYNQIKCGPKSFSGGDYADFYPCPALPAPQENDLPRTSLVQRHKQCESIC